MPSKITAGRPGQEITTLTLISSVGLQCLQYIFDTVHWATLSTGFNLDIPRNMVASAYCGSNTLLALLTQQLRLHAYASIPDE